jgi:hypothetical protein
MNFWFVGAAILSGLVCLLHIFGGGPGTVPALIKKDAGSGGVGRMTAYYAWHLVTITIAAQALAFWIAAGSDAAHDLALFAAGGALLFALWSIAMIAIHRLKPMLFPQWLLFLPIAAAGFIGLYW